MSWMLPGNDEAMKVARALMVRVWPGDGLMRDVGGQWMVWEGERWVTRDDEWLTGRVMVELEDANWQKNSANGPVTVRYAPTPMKVSGVVAGLKALAREAKRGWDKGDPAWAIAFGDVVVTEEGTVRRDRGWVGPVVDCEWDPEAACPRWMKALEEWGVDEGAMRRLFGYVLLGHRRFERWFLWLGPPRSGKTTAKWVLGEMAGGVFETTLEELSGAFGLSGAEDARVVVVNEVTEGGGVHKAGGLLKQIVGRDGVQVNGKYQKAVQRVIPAVVLVIGNEVPSLPNRGRGLSDKMVSMEFQRSFVGNETWDLREALREEMAGIAAWAVRGAWELRQEQWEAGKGEVAEEYRKMNNEADQFLDSVCVEAVDGPGVEVGVLWDEWLAWRKDMGVSTWVSRNVFTSWLRREGTWVLKLAKSSGIRRVRGVALRVDRVD